MTCKRVARTFKTLALLAGFSWAVVGQTQYPGDPSAAAQPAPYPQAVSAAPGQANVQAVSTSGLLPVYGIELRAEKGWVDSQFPSHSASFPNAGVSSAFQAAWDSLKAGGFNILRVPLDVRDPQSANRLANMCLWAKNNNVRILPVLSGATQPDYDAQAGALVKAAVSALRNSQAADAYLQIAAYQLDDEMNHAGVHGPLPSSIAQQLVKAAQSVRSAERQALEGANTEPTPLMASASFDYELIQARAIAGVPFGDAAYRQAYSSLLHFLQPLAQSPDLDLLSVTWFPGTVSAGTVDKPPLLIRSLAADLAGKQIVFATGFSTAFSSADDQKTYYTMTFANLGDLRASAAGDSPFVGVVFREALNGRNPQAPKGVAERMKGWDWPGKADELAAMWNGKRKSEDMKWWWEKVQSNMGLASLQTAAGNPQLTAQPAQQALGQIASAVSETNAAAGPYPQYPGQDASAAYGSGTPSGYAGGSTAPGATSASGGGASSPAFKDALQARLVGLLDAALQRAGGSLGAAGGGRYSGTYPGDNGGYPGQYPQSGQYPNATQYSGQSQAGQSPNQSYPQGQYDPNQAYPQGQYQPSNPYPDPNQQYPGQAPSGAQYPANNGTNAGATAGYPGMPGNAGSIAPGAILISPQDVVVQPNNPQAGQLVTLAAKVRNQGASDATGLIVVASDQANTVLAQADSVNVARGSAASVSLQFVPAEPQTSLSLGLHVSDALGNEIASAPLAAITIAAMPSGSGSADPGTGSGTGSDPGASGGTATPGGAGSTQFIAPLGVARLAMVPLQRFLIAGEPVPVMANMSNPFSIPVRNVHATLLVDGVAIGSQSMNLLLPHQTRSLVFSNVIVSKPGTHEVKVAVESQRGNARPQASYLVSKITFYSPHSVPATPRGVGAGPLVHPGASTGAGGALSAASRVRSISPTAFIASTHPGSPSGPHLQPPTINGSGGPPSLNSRSISPPPATSGGTRGITGSSSASTATAGNFPTGGNSSSSPAYRAGNAPRPFVSLNPNEISYGPAPAKPGQAVTFNVIVRNSAEAPAQRVTLVLKLFADGRLVALTQRPIQFSVGPRGAFRATWQAGMPAARQVLLVAAVAADGDSNPNGKQTSIAVRTSAPQAQPRIGTPTGARIQH